VNAGNDPTHIGRRLARASRSALCSSKKDDGKTGAMTTALPSLADLTDEQLLARVNTLAHEERRATAALIAALAELDERRLYLGQGYTSLFAYCSEALSLSEDAAYNRIRAARVAAKWPIVLKMIADGSLSVTVVRLLSDVLTNTNHEDLLRAACHKSKRHVEEQIAALRPKPAVSPTIREVATSDPKPVRAAATSPPLLTTTSLTPNEERCTDALPTPAPLAKPPSVAPLSAQQYKVQFTIPKATHDIFRRVQDLMRHTNPNGDPAVIFVRALTLLLEHLEKTKLAKTTRARTEARATRPGSRHVPSAVKREVWTRDGGQCAFVGTAGRCRETGFLEYHHVVPYADGGGATLSNIQLRCRAHNAYEADEWFGPLAPVACQRSGALPVRRGPADAESAAACRQPANDGPSAARATT
jgi:hypothetical protein